MSGIIGNVKEWNVVTAYYAVEINNVDTVFLYQPRGNVTFKKESKRHG